eukprot:jgi/Hompol1/4395/HPOL_001045-RA
MRGSTGTPSVGAAAAAMLLLLLSLLAGSVSALRFELHASPGQGTRKCLDMFVPKESLVAGSVDIPYVSGQKISVEIIDESHDRNKYWTKPNVRDEQKFSFTVHVDVDLRFCFTNVLDEGQVPGPSVKRTIYLQVDTGAEATSFLTEQEREKLKPVEQQLIRLEGLAQEIIHEMMLLEHGDIDMDGVNQKTLDRIANFSTFSIVALLALGGWQI